MPNFTEHLNLESDRSKFMGWYDKANRDTRLRRAVVEVIGGLGIAPVATVLIIKAAVKAVLDR